MAFDNFLAPGRYYASPHCRDADGPGAGVVDSRERAAAFVVTGSAEEGSLANLPHDLTVERSDGRRAVGMTTYPATAGRGRRHTGGERGSAPVRC